MNHLSSVALVILAVMLIITEGLPAVQNTSGHDIIEGSCSRATYQDRVYYDHVDKMAIPLYVRSEEVRYSGDRVIYCIQALNQKNNKTGGSAVIIGGGVGQKYANIDLKSYRGHGLEYYVSIFAY